MARSGGTGNGPRVADPVRFRTNNQQAHRPLTRRRPLFLDQWTWRERAGGVWSIRSRAATSSLKWARKRCKRGNVASGHSSQESSTRTAAVEHFLRSYNNRDGWATCSERDTGHKNNEKQITRQTYLRVAPENACLRALRAASQLA